MGDKSMDEQKIHKRKRPVGVWVISIFILISVVWTLLSFYLIFTGAIPITDAQRKYFENLTMVDHIHMSLSIIANLAGVIYLLLLRKVAFYIFFALLFLGIFSILYEYWPINEFGIPILIGAVLGITIDGIICYYLWRLKVKGILR
jgi:hypothetical protein